MSTPTPERPPFRLADEEEADDDEVLRIARDVTRRRPGLIANLADAERRELLDEVERLRAEVAVQRETVLRLRSGFKAIEPICRAALDQP